jgi:hypothetical protein
LSITGKEPQEIGLCLITPLTHLSLRGEILGKSFLLPYKVIARLLGNVVAQFIGLLRLMNQATIPFFVFARHDSAEAISLGDNEIATPRQVGVHNDMEGYYPMLLSYYKVSPLYLSFRTPQIRQAQSHKKESVLQ